MSLEVHAMRTLSLVPLLLFLVSCDDYQGGGVPTEVEGDVSWVHIEPHSASLGEWYSGRDRIGERVFIMDVNFPCDDVVDNLTDVTYLELSFRDTEPAVYAVVDPDDYTINEKYVSARIIKVVGGETTYRAEATGGTVTLDAINPTDWSPLHEGSRATGSFQLEFETGPNFLRTSGSDTSCDPYCNFNTCQRPDGTIFTCEWFPDIGFCCNDGVTEIFQVSGSFSADFCVYV
jgi:hypothetical protein